MAVVARGLEYLFHLRGSLEVGRYGWILQFRPNELDAHECDAQNRNDPDKNPKKSRSCCHVSTSFCVSIISNELVGDAPIVEAALLAKHGIFRRLNPSVKSWPTPPDKKQSEHNGRNCDHNQVDHFPGFSCGLP